MDYTSKLNKNPPKLKRVESTNHLKLESTKRNQ